MTMQVCVHDMENEEVVQEGEKKMLAAGVTGPEGHAQAHIEEAETEAVMRAAVIANQVLTNQKPLCHGTDQ